ncbi:hypothetical protein V1522DRAFT_412831 [Lipomyces starkeyi]
MMRPFPSQRSSLLVSRRTSLAVASSNPNDRQMNNQAYSHHSPEFLPTVLYICISITTTSVRLTYYVMDTVNDPKQPAASRVSRSVAQIATSAVNHAKAREYERKPTGNVTEAAGKRKAVYDCLRRETDLTRNCAPSSDQSEEQGKRLKLNSSS